jgi:prepilin-type N-terminal cleavage/methylation domain-containing protein
MFHQENQRHPRRGFTLIELMVVMLIIVVLVSLSVGAGWVVISNQRVERTRDSLQTMNQVFQAQWKRVVDDTKLEAIPPGLVTLAGGDEGRAKVLLIKLRLAEAFPQSYAEVTRAMASQSYPAPTSLASVSGAIYQNFPTLGYLILPDKHKYMPTYYKAISASVAANHLQSTESAALLLLALSETRGGIKIDLNNMARNIADTDNDGVNELVDNYGQPVYFVRFPIYATAYATFATTGLPAGTFPPIQASPNWGVPPNPNPALPPSFYTETALYFQTNNPLKGSPKVKNSDPVDADGLLQDAKWLTTAVAVPGLGTITNAQFFATLCNHPFPAPVTAGLGGQYGTAGTSQPYWVPFIASAGPDSLQFTGDDIATNKLRVGSQGN